MIVLLAMCSQPEKEKDPASIVRDETQRAWNAYKEYAWGHDVLLPIAKSSKDWYDEPLYISPIDAYSTLQVMGLEKEADEIEQYIADSIDFNKDIFVKTFEVNIRILGGLLAIYQFSQNEKILNRAKDFGNRLLPAFNSATGIPHYWVNLMTGEVKGDTVNTAEGGSYLLEMGVLSYFTKEPVYYQAAKNASRALISPAFLPFQEICRKLHACKHPGMISGTGMVLNPWHMTS